MGNDDPALRKGKVARVELLDASAEPESSRWFIICSSITYLHEVSDDSRVRQRFSSSIKEELQRSEKPNPAQRTTTISEAKYQSLLLQRIIAELAPIKLYLLLGGRGHLEAMRKRERPFALIIACAQHPRYCFIKKKVWRW